MADKEIRIRCEGDEIYIHWAGIDSVMELLGILRIAEVKIIDRHEKEACEDVPED